MISETIVIAGSAASLGFVHTILGPDHYLPLVAMAKTNGWSAPKTASYVAVCGISHLLGTGKRLARSRQNNKTSYFRSKKEPSTDGSFLFEAIREKRSFILALWRERKEV